MVFPIKPIDAITTRKVQIIVESHSENFFFLDWLELNLPNLILNLLGSNFGNKLKNIEEYQEPPQSSPAL